MKMMLYGMAHHVPTDRENVAGAVKKCHSTMVVQLYLCGRSNAPCRASVLLLHC